MRKQSLILIASLLLLLTLATTTPARALAPTITPIGDVTLEAGDVRVIAISATDPSGGIKFSLLMAPAYVSLHDEGNGEANLKIAPGCDDIGTSSVIVQAVAADNLTKIRAFVCDLATHAGIKDAASFCQVWHMLMKGCIIAATEGNRDAALHAKRAAKVLLANWADR